MRYLKLALASILVIVLLLGCPRRQEVVVEEPEEVVEEKAPERPALVLNRIFFDFDKSDIRPDAAEVLKQNAEMLKLYPEVNVVIEGHCCEIGTAEYNMALGERRAKAAYDYLVNLGVPSTQLSTISYGEERPLDPKDLKKNRRCEFTIK
ncbi:MAG: OmpA family protein [candidate division WOR-3 bacterium]